MADVPKDLVFDARISFCFDGQQLKTSCKNSQGQLGQMLFNIFKDMVTPASKQAREFTVKICILLKGARDLELAGSSPRPAEQLWKPEQQIDKQNKPAPEGHRGQTPWNIEWLIVAPARNPPARSYGISSGHNHPPTSIQVTATEDWEQLNQHPPAAATEDWEQLNQHPPAALNCGYATPHRTTREELKPEQHITAIKGLDGSICYADAVSCST
ncbi:hypothetical protein F511_08937 [Dorcoceras hygrometricum]|uniref:Uncharacterized protein n=1 Tax=Dorcoceras hygrometricum TaxID=472368 RepID=A0A2Z7A385_9LAMI|nr:hypothetical protein F511_08937 [Dorcoceras hygrometricum]